jgi:hypothetical protein
MIKSDTRDGSVRLGSRRIDDQLAAVERGTFDFDSLAHLLVRAMALTMVEITAKYAGGGDRRRRPRRSVVTQVGRGCCSPQRERSFLDQSNAHIFFTNFAVFVGVDLGAIFVIARDAERATQLLR